jgi:anti-sigma B factor antagonist
MWKENITIMRQEGWPEGVPTLQVLGPLTGVTLDEFMQAVRAEEAPTLIVDMSGVPYVDSSGVGGIINAHVSRRNSGRRFILTGLTERVRAHFQLTKVERILTIYPTLRAAQDDLALDLTS